MLTPSSLKVPERYEKCFRVSSTVKRKSITTPLRKREWTTSSTANVGGTQMNPKIQILPLSITSSLLGGRMNAYRSGKLLVLRMRHYPWKRKQHKLANDMKMWKGNRNTAALLFYLKGFEILHQEIIGKVNMIVMEHFNCILFHKSGPANIFINQ